MAMGDFWLQFQLQTFDSLRPGHMSWKLRSNWVEVLISCVISHIRCLTSICGRICEKGTIVFLITLEQAAVLASYFSERQRKGSR